MSSRIIILQAPGKDHLKYIKGRATRLWESRGMLKGKLRECIKETLENHCKSLKGQIHLKPAPSRCDYCGAETSEKEVKECSPYCRPCWKKHFSKTEKCCMCNVSLVPEDVKDYETYCEWCWKNHILKG